MDQHLHSLSDSAINISVFFINFKIQQSFVFDTFKVRKLINYNIKNQSAYLFNLISMLKINHSPILFFALITQELILLVIQWSWKI